MTLNTISVNNYSFYIYIVAFCSIQGLFHTQVLQLLLSSHEHVTIRATPLKNTR